MQFRFTYDKSPPTVQLEPSSQLSKPTSRESRSQTSTAAPSNIRHTNFRLLEFQVPMSWKDILATKAVAFEVPFSLTRRNRGIRLRLSTVSKNVGWTPWQVNLVELGLLGI